MSRPIRSKNHRLAKELEDLPKRQKEAIYLRFAQELTYGQITEIMNLRNIKPCAGSDLQGTQNPAAEPKSILLLF